MITDLKIGILVCTHGNLYQTKSAAKAFKKADVDAIILAGDIPDFENQEKSLSAILRIMTRLGKKIYLMPGSHEQYEPYYAAVRKFRSQITNIANVRRITIKGRNIVFIPGSLSNTPGAAFRLMSTRKHLSVAKRAIKENKKHFWGKGKFLYTCDATKLLDKDTIIISHDPPRGKNKKGIDVAKFGMPKEEFTLKAKDWGMDATTNPNVIMRPKKTIFPLNEAKMLIKKGHPIQIMRRNVGNKYLRKIIDTKGASKLICGHIHESTGAIDSKGRKVREGTWNKELFYNTAAKIANKAGIVEFSGDKARYTSIQLKNGGVKAKLINLLFKR